MCYGDVIRAVSSGTVITSCGKRNSPVEGKGNFFYEMHCEVAPERERELTKLIGGISNDVASTFLV